MSSTIIVDGTVADLLLEYGTILDSIQKSHEYSLNLTQLQESEQVDKLTQLLIDSIEIIFKLNERDFEPVFNLFLYLLTSVSNEDLELTLSKSGITTRCLDIIDNNNNNNNNNNINNINNNDDDDDKKINNKLDSTILISILTTIFNTLPAQLKFRFNLLETIITILDKTNNVSPILELEYLLWYQWLKPITTTDSEIVLFLQNVIDILNREYPELSLKLYQDVIINLNDSLTGEDVDKFLVQSFNNEFKLDFSSYVNLSLSKLSLDYIKILELYNSKDLSSFENYYQQNIDKFQAIDKDNLTLKLQIIKLISTCYGSNKISYDELLKLLNMNSIQDLENLIIYSIKKNFINGKLNQFKKCFEINNVKYLGEFDVENWKLVQLKLNNWKNSLKEIKENIDNNNNNNNNNGNKRKF